MEKSQQIQESYYRLPYHHVSRFEGGFSQTFNDPWGINYVSTIEFMLKKAAEEKAASIVDVGCGDGRLTCELKKRFPQARVIGVDYSEHAIALAKAMSPDTDFRAFDIRKGCPADRFNVAILMEVFEHIPPAEADDFVRAVGSLLTENGLLFLTVPHINKPVEPAHFRHFSVESLGACFAKRFEILEMIPFERRSVQKRIIDRILTNNFFILNHSRLRNALYAYYKRRLFPVRHERECQRIFMKARLKRSC